jgi:hypothetical protein
MNLKEEFRFTAHVCGESLNLDFDCGNSDSCCFVAAMLTIAAAIAYVTLMAGVAAAFVSQRHEVAPFRHHHFHASSSSSSLSQERLVSSTFQTMARHTATGQHKLPRTPLD